MLPKLDRYILRKYLGTFVFMVLTITVLGAVIDFSEKLGDFLSSKASNWGIFRYYYLNFMLFLANMLMPICVFLAVILFTGKLTQDSETVAILSSGVSFQRLLRPYLIAAAFLGGLSFWLNGWVVPHATGAFESYYYNSIRNRDFLKDSHIHRKVGEQSFVYMYNFNQYDNEGRQFSLEEFRNGQLLRRTLSPRVVYNDSTGRWTLFNPVVRHFHAQGERMEQRRTFDTTLFLTPNDIYKPNTYSKSLTIPELNTRIVEEQQRGGDYTRALQYELQERYAYPVAIVILTVMGFALSTRKRRGGIALQLGLGLVLAFAYIIVLSTAKTVMGEEWPVWLAIWMPNLIFSVVAWLLLRWAPK
ncbi:MAG: LptF/LptG family permease [Bacteroidetes bacterium]|nr:LptF/LptG family permease [Bacteroidota bacterium]